MISFYDLNKNHNEQELIIRILKNNYYEWHDKYDDINEKTTNYFDDEGELFEI